MSDTRLTQEQRFLWRAFSTMSRQLARAVDARLHEDAGISSAEFEILQALDERPDHQARARELAEMLAWEKSRISHQVTRMVNRGLVNRAECATDLRGTWVSLAPAGKRALEQALPGYHDEVRARFSSLLDSTQIDTLTQVALGVIDATAPESCKAEIGREQPGSVTSR